MKTRFIRFICLALVFTCMFTYQALNVQAETGGVTITAKNGKQLELGAKSLYVNGTLAASNPGAFQFKTLHEAVAAAVDGTQAKPMTIYIEPDVYQMNGTLHDRGLYVDKDWVSLIGLAEDARDVVLADNRGHTIGAESASGSSPAETIFITGTGFHAENLTIGNYCNVDLVYPRDPSKNQEKRSSTITQAYVIGAANKEKKLDHYSFNNVRFVSMLDTLALGEVERVYYENSYVQGTDDYMGGGVIQVMKNTTLHNFTNKPIYAAGKEGMAFIDCVWEVDFADSQDLFLAKNSSTLYLINNSFKDLNGNLKSIQWAPYPASNIKSYAHNITLDGKPYTILPEENGTVLNQEQLKAYSVYSLLKGEDGWDPAGMKTTAAAAEKDLPINISVTQSAAIRTGEGSAELTAGVFPASASQNITWSINSDAAVLSATTGASVKVEGRNTGEEPVKVTVTATADNGISNQAVVTVSPSFIDAPAFTQAPVLTEPQNGTVSVQYGLDLAYEKGVRADQSLVTWYRVDDKNGSNPVEMAVSRGNKPLGTYALTVGDVGYYVMASVQPKHLRSHEGPAVTAVSSRAITLEDISGTGIEKYNYRTTFENFSTTWQPKLLNGVWTVDTLYPLDQKVEWKVEEKSAWSYTKGINGAADSQGLLTTGRGGRLLYPLDGRFGDMSLQLKLNPEKTAGQGFGSANGQYLEVYIKYDAATQTGYALRIERTTKYGIATDYTLYEYVNGAGKPISESVSTTAFNPGATIDLRVENNTLYAKAVSATAQSSDQKEAKLPNEVSLSAVVGGNSFGGFGLQHTGTVGAGNRTQLLELAVAYKEVPEAPAGEQPAAPEAPAAEQPAVEQPAAPQEPAAAPSYTTYTVKAGDNLSAIAKALLGSANQWRTLYEWNKDIIANPDLIYIGQELKIKR